MLTRWLTCLSLAFVAACASSPPPTPDPSPASSQPAPPVEFEGAASSQPSRSTRNESRADRLAREVVEAFGDPLELPGIQFGFEVQIEGEVALSRFHIWCPAKGKASVTSRDGVTTVVDVTEVPTDPDKAEAHSSFINDSYWVFAPAKLFDPGVNRELTEDGELHIWFEDGTGLTPGDHYWFEIDEASKRITHWRFELESGRAASFSWEGYARFGPLTLATTHLRDDAMIIRHPNMAVLPACPFD